MLKAHKGVHTQFARLTRNEPRLGRELRQFLAQAYDMKSIADYGLGLVPMCRSTVPARRSTPPNNSSTGSRSCRRSSPEDSGNALPFCAPSRNEYAATLTGGARSARRIVRAARSPRRQHPGWPVIFSLHDGSASGDSRTIVKLIGQFTYPEVSRATGRAAAV